eukprot:4043164-Pleurochrysis_carterae.AAC.2
MSSKHVHTPAQLHCPPTHHSLSHHAKASNRVLVLTTRLYTPRPGPFANPRPSAASHSASVRGRPACASRAALRSLPREAAA